MTNTPQDALIELFSQAITQLKTDGVIPVEHDVKIMFERTRQKEHGDYATNVALTLAKPAGKNPRALADLIVAALPADAQVSKVEIAGPGFINVFLAEDARYTVLDNVFNQGPDYGLAEPDSKQKILVEFVSANPTGPLHVGHGRGAVYGDALARVLSAAGHTVEREYYVNDAGRQMEILATSVWIRYAQIAGNDIPLPSNGYQGEYIQTMAQELFEQHANQFVLSPESLVSAQSGLEDEAALDALIKSVKDQLGDESYQLFFRKALDSILDDIKDDLAGFGINYDTWYS